MKVKLSVGMKVRAKTGVKVRLVTEVSECGRYFKWGGNESWNHRRQYVPVASDRETNHSVER